VVKEQAVLTVALAALLLGAASAAAKSRLDLTVNDPAGAPIEGAQVTVTAAAGDPFTASGATDKKGRYRAELPDLDRAYLVKVEKAGFTAFDDKLDFPAQGVTGRSAEVTVALVTRGPIEVHNEGVRALQAHDVETALARFRDAVTMKPDFKEAWRALSGLRVMQKDYAGALEAADRLLALDPAEVDALRDRYEALSGLGRGEEAKAALDTLFERDRSPEAAKLLYNAGADAWNGKDATVARKRFEQALGLDPKLYQAHSAMAEIFISEKNFVEAAAELDRVIAIAPRNFKAYERKIEVLKAGGKAAEAAEVEKALAALKAGG
jgi:tetratricopeptide (TPR) repeat protein